MIQSRGTLSYPKDAALRTSLSAGGVPSYLIFLLFFLNGIIVSIILLAVPLYALDLGAGKVMLGSLVSGLVASGACLSFHGAMLSDHFGRRSVIICSFLFFAAANVVCVLAASPLWLLLGMTAAGAGDLLFTVAGLTYLTEVVTGDDYESFTQSAAFSLWPAGSVAGSLLGGHVIEWLGFSAVFLLGAIVSTVCICLSLSLRQEKSPAERKLAPFRRVLAPYEAAYDLLQTNKIVRLVPLVTALGALGWFTFRSTFYLDYLHQLEMSAGAIGFLMALGSAAKMLAPFFYFFLSRRIGALRTILFGLLFGALGLAVIPFLRAVSILAIVGTLAQMAAFFRLPGVFALLRVNTRSQERATSVAIVNTSWALTALLGGPLLGLVVRATGLSNTFLIAGLGTMLGAAVLLIRNRRL